jgi:hypothetical protein
MTALTTKDWIKIGINTFFGLLTLIMQHYVPIAGGGSSLIFVLTVPATLALSSIATLLYLFMKPRKTRDFIIYTAIILNLWISIAMFPYG